MKKRNFSRPKISNTEQSKSNNDQKSNSIGSLSNLGGFNLLSGAITTNTYTTDDESFYCKLSRGYNSISMIINLIIIFLIFCFISFYLYRFLKRKISKKR